MSKYLSILFFLLAFKTYAMSNEIDVTIDNLPCLGFEISSLADDHLIIVFPPTIKDYELTNTLVSYSFLGEKTLISQNRFHSSSKVHEVEISFLQGINNGADATLIAYYSSRGDSKIFKFSSLAKLVNAKTTECKKL